MNKNKIKHQFISYKSPYFDRFKTISLNDFSDSEKELLIAEMSINKDLIFEIVYVFEQERFCFQSFYKNKRINFIVLNKISKDDLYEEYELIKMIYNVLDFISTTNKTNYSYIDVLENKELVVLIRIFLLPSLKGTLIFDLYIIGDSYICFYKNLDSKETAYIIINHEKFNEKLMKHTQDFEYHYVVKKDEELLTKIEESIKEVNQKTSKDVSNLFLYLI